jgi:hypothetical protein
MSKVKIGSNNDIICYGTVEDTTSYQMDFSFIYTLTMELDSLHLKIFGDHWAFGLDLIERNDLQGYYFAVLGFSSSSGPGNIVSLDNSFNVKKIVGIDQDLNNMSSIQYTDPTHFIVTGEYEKSWPYEPTRDIGAVYYDTAFTPKHFKAYGKIDTEDCPGFFKNIGVSDAHSIFIAGTANFDYGSILSTQDSWYLLNNVDTTLGLNWQKYYGGDGYYSLFGILATRDSGCLMFGTFWDYHHTQKRIRYLSLIKVTKEGQFLSVNNEPTASVHEVIIYPNPGNDRIYVETQLKNATFFLYDLTGREVLHVGLLPGRISIQIQNLNSGIYIYKVIQNSQVKECGKWIKE